jgi:hypothetical protein
MSSQNLALRISSTCRGKETRPSLIRFGKCGLYFSGTGLEVATDA